MNHKDELSKSVGTRAKRGLSVSAGKGEPLPPPSAAGDRSFPWKVNLLGEFISQPAWAFLDGTPVEKIEWSKPARRALQIAKCKNLGDLCRRTRESWRGERRVKPQTIAEFEKVIRASIASRQNEPIASRRQAARNQQKAPPKYRQSQRIFPQRKFAWQENLLGEFIAPAAWTLLDAAPVTVIPWSQRAFRALQFADCKTLGEICRRTRDSWQAYRWIGKNTLAEFAQAIRSAIAAGPTRKIAPARTSPAEPLLAGAKAALANQAKISPPVWSAVIKDLKTTLPQQMTIGEAADLVGEICPPSSYDEPFQKCLAQSPQAFLGFAGVGKKKAAILTRCVLKLWLRSKLGPHEANALLGENLQAIAADLTAGKFRQGLTKAIALAQIKPRQLRILDLRYGLSDSTPRTLEECGQVLGVTREAVRQMEALAHARLVARPDLRWALEQGLAANQTELHERISGLGDATEANARPAIHFYNALGTWESLLIDLCHGDVVTWLRHGVQTTGAIFQAGRPGEVGSGPSRSF